MKMCFLLANFLAYWCRDSKVAATDKAGLFWDTV